MKKYSIILLTVFALSYCKNSESPKTTFIPADSMVQLIIDIHLADAVFNESTQRRPVARNLTLKDYYDKIINDHGYTRELFDTSLNFYSRKPAEYEKIYEKVIESLQRMDGDLDKEISIESRKMNDNSKQVRDNLPDLKNRLKSIRETNKSE